MHLPFRTSDLKTISENGVVKGYIVTKEQMDMLQDFLDDLEDNLHLEKAIEDAEGFVDFDDWKEKLTSEGKING